MTIERNYLAAPWLNMTSLQLGTCILTVAVSHFTVAKRNVSVRWNFWDVLVNGTQGQYEILIVNVLANIRGCFRAQ